jgi:hypothetical protein
MDAPPVNGPPAGPASDGDPSLSSIRRILFAAESERLDRLDGEKKRLEGEIAALQERLSALQGDLAAAEARLRDETAALAAEIDDVIAQRAANAPEEMAEALGPVMAGALRVQDRQARADLVDAVGPVLGEAIETQIRQSRQSIVEALYPIIGEMAARFIGESFRELQRNIDARLKSTFGPERYARRASARLRGVAAADVEMRDALPFHVREIFLIESGSGLLLTRAGSDEALDSDLVSGMLTAVRDFMHDSFRQDGGIAAMDEIQYGEERIIIQDGRLCYVAVVIHGIEPPGFRAELHRFINRVQADNYQALQTYGGDTALLGDIPPAVARLADELTGLAPPPPGPRPMSRGQKWALALGGIGGLLALALGCFYLQFTLALLPVAFGDATPTVTHTATATPTMTATATPTMTPTATATPTATPTMTPTATASPSATPTPTATIVPFGLVTNRTVWLFAEPDLTSARLAPLPEGTPVTLIDYADPWLLVEWQSATGPQQGWLSIRWVEWSGTPPPEFPATPGE